MKKLGVLVCATMAAILGCSISDSSESISDSVSSPFEMMSDSSSGGGEGDTAYRDDVSDHTRTVVAAGGSAADVADDLGSLARRHGITDWESRDSTFEGVGRGLALAGVDGADLGSYERLLAADAQRAAVLRRGFDGAAAAPVRP